MHVHPNIFLMIFQNEHSLHHVLARIFISDLMTVDIEKH